MRRIGIYTKSHVNQDDPLDRQEGNLETMETGDFTAAISSPPYNLPMSQDHNGARGGARGTTPSESGAFAKYGNSEGQLEGMSMGGFEAAVSSPPYESSPVSSDRNFIGGGGNETAAASCERKGYGEAEASLGNLPRGNFEAAVTSPPYEATEGSQGAQKHKDPAAVAKMRAESYTNGTYKGHPASEEAIRAQLEREANQNYGEDPDNMGYKRGEDFRSASRLILEQLFQILKPGAHAVFVVKAFVRNKKVVDFPDQWAQLCEAVGFRLLHDHHALLTEHYGTQGGFEEDKKLSVSRKSFFRRLHEKKNPSTKIEWESVLCFVKPE